MSAVVATLLSILFSITLLMLVVTLLALSRITRRGVRREEWVAFFNRLDEDLRTGRIEPAQAEQISRVAIAVMRQEK